MKKLLLLFVLIFALQSCVSASNANGAGISGVSIEKNEADSWQLKVNDPQFESYLAIEAKPINRYTESFLRSKNTFLVQEWNTYFYTKSSPLVISSIINYNPTEKYGLHFEYKLYQYFVMVHMKNAIVFNNLDMMDK